MTAEQTVYVVEDDERMRAQSNCFFALKVIGFGLTRMPRHFWRAKPLSNRFASSRTLACPGWMGCPSIAGLSQSGRPRPRL